MRTVGYAYDADVHCVNCAQKRFGSELENDDAGDSGGNPIHPISDYDEGGEHGDVCGDCGGEISPAWCEGCSDCAPDLTVHVENSEGDPWGCTMHVYAESSEALEKWLHRHGGSIGGSSWESEGNFAYAMSFVHVGCAEEWRREGYTNLDLSAFCDDPLERFAGMSEEELDAEFDGLRSRTGLEADDEARIRKQIARQETKT